MKPALVVAVLAALVAAAAGPARSGLRRARTLHAASSGEPARAPLPRPCPPGTLPDQGVCIPVPPPAPAED